MNYRHTQWGYSWVPTAAIFLFVNLFSFTADDTALWLIALIVAFEVALLAVVVWFSRLEVAVGSDAVTASFGRGWPTRSIGLTDIKSVRPVRNQWYLGLGVRGISNGWMYNVWGLDAVEMELVSDDVFRIGTNDVERLHAAIAMGSSI